MCNYFPLIFAVDQNLSLEIYSAMGDITEETRNQVGLYNVALSSILLLLYKKITYCYCH